MAPDLIESAAEGVKTTRSGVERGGGVSLKKDGAGVACLGARLVSRAGTPREDPVNPLRHGRTSCVEGVRRAQ